MYIVIWAMSKRTGVFSPKIHLYVSVQIAVWAVLNFLELVLAHLRIELKMVATDQSNPDSINSTHLDQPLCNTRELAGGKWHLKSVINFVFDHLPIFE